jgi:hypothetical protein
MAVTFDALCLLIENEEFGDYLFQESLFVICPAIRYLDDYRLEHVIQICLCIFQNEENEIFGRAAALAVLSIIVQIRQRIDLATHASVWMMNAEDPPIIIACIYLITSALWVSNGEYQNCISEEALSLWESAVTQEIFPDLRAWRICAIGLSFLVKVRRNQLEAVLRAAVAEVERRMEGKDDTKWNEVEVDYDDADFDNESVGDEELGHILAPEIWMPLDDVSLS